MTTIATYGILFDVLLWMTGALVLALPIYGFLRRDAPGYVWSGGGRVGVVGVRFSDLFLVFGLASLLWGAMVYAPFAMQQKSALAESLTASFLASGEITPIRLLSSQLQLTFLAAMLFLYITVHRELRMSEMLLGKHVALGVNAGIAVLAFVGSVVVMVLVEDQLDDWLKAFWPKGDQQDSVRMIRSNVSSYGLKDMAILFTTVVILAPLTEEVIFRGFFYPVLKKYTDRWFSMLLVSLFFASIHMNIPAFVPLFLLAVGFTLAYEWTGSLLTPMLMHAIFNGLQLYLMFKGE